MLPLLLSLGARLPARPAPYDKEAGKCAGWAMKASTCLTEG